MKFLWINIDSLMKRNFGFQITFSIQVGSLHIADTILMGWIEKKDICWNHLPVLHFNKITNFYIFPFKFPFHKLFIFQNGGHLFICLFIFFISFLC